MKQLSNWFLRAAIFFIGAAVLAICIFALPSIWKGGSAEYPEASRALLATIGIMYAAAIPFFIGLWQALKLLALIDRKKAFSELSIKALKNIKYCALVIAALYVINVPLLFPIAQADDAPGLILVGMAFACAPIAVAVFATLLQRLLQDALAIKSENDLTV